MATQPIHSLLVHGSIVLLFGILSGIPFWIAIIRSEGKGTIRAWRVAHTTLIACGLMMIAVSLISPYVSLETELRAIMVWVFVVSGYGFVFALIVGAGTSYRALTPHPFGFNTLLFTGHLIGAAGAILGMCIFLYGLL